MSSNFRPTSECPDPVLPLGSQGLLRVAVDGDWARVVRCVRVAGYVNATDDFTAHSQVIDGASDFFYELFGPERGKHARTAVGMFELPHGIPVEINGEFEVYS